MVPNFGISKITPPQHLIGQSLEEAGLGGPRYRHSITVLAIRRGREPILFPAKEEVISPGDLLFVACRDDRLDRMRRREAPPHIQEETPTLG